MLTKRIKYPSRLVDFFIPSRWHVHLRIGELIKKPNKLHLMTIAERKDKFVKSEHFHSCNLPVFDSVNDSYRAVLFYTCVLLLVYFSIYSYLKFGKSCRLFRKRIISNCCTAPLNAQRQENQWEVIYRSNWLGSLLILETISFNIWLWK